MHVEPEKNLVQNRQKIKFVKLDFLKIKYRSIMSKAHSHNILATVLQSRTLSDKYLRHLLCNQPRNASYLCQTVPHRLSRQQNLQTKVRNSPQQSQPWPLMFYIVQKDLSKPVLDHSRMFGHDKLWLLTEGRSRSRKIKKNVKYMS